MILSRAACALSLALPLSALAQGGRIEASSLVDASLRGIASPNGHSTVENRRGLQSEDGRYAVFTTMASNLDAGIEDANGDTDAWLFDRADRSLTLISRSAALPDRTAAGASRPVAISRDGARVLFLSTATDLVAGQLDGNAAEDAFLFERASGQVHLVSRRVTSATATGNRGVIDAQLSADGALVLFSTLSTDLDPNLGDNNGDSDVYRYDLINRIPQAASTSGTNAAVTANGRSVLGDVAPDASRFAIVSNATNLVPGQGTTSVDQIYALPRFGGTRTLVSHAAAGALQPANAASGAPRFSPDGGSLVFLSQATDLVAGVADGNGGNDVFLHAFADGTNALVSFAAGNPARAANAISVAALVSDGAERIAFVSAATDLVAGLTDANGSGLDVYLHERGGAHALVSHRAGAPATTGSASSALLHGLSDNGKQVLYRSAAADLVAGQVDAPNDIHLFLYALGEDRNDLVSFRAGAPATASASQATRASLSADGSSVLFDGGDDLGDDDDNARDDAWQFHAGKNLQLTRRDPAADNLATARNGGRAEPRSLSEDGRRAAFFSASPDLVQGVTGGVLSALYVSDRLDGSSVLVSHAAGQPAVRSAVTPQREIALSGDGQYIAFLSNATDLAAGVTGVDGNLQVWLARTDGSDAVLVSHAAHAPFTAANGPALGTPSVSRDGRFVAYLSRATDLIAGYSGPAVENLWLYDRDTGTHALVNHAFGDPRRSDGPAAPSFALTPDGAHVAFASAAAGLTALPDNNGNLDVFLHATATGQTLAVSRSHGNARMATGSSDSPDVSDDGGVVVFRSTANDLQPVPAISGGVDVFRWQRSDDSVALVTRRAADPARHADGGAAFVQTDAAGRRVLFSSFATTLVDGFVNLHGSPAVFVYDHADGRVRLIDHGAGTPATTLGDPILTFVLARGGTHAAFNTRATNVVAGSTDSAGSLDTFVVDLDSDERFIASHRFGEPLVTASAQVAPAAVVPAISRDGMITAFSAQSRDMMLHDVNGVADAHRFVLLEPTRLRANAPEPSPVRVGEAYEVQAEVELVRGPARGRVRVSDGEAACEFTLDAGDDSRGACTLASASPGDKVLSVEFTSTQGFAASSTNVAQRVLPPLSADLSIALAAPATVDTGAAFALQATVSNAGPDAAPDARIEFAGLPGAAAFSGAGWSCAGSACTHGALAAGASAGVTLQLAAPLQDGTLELSATVASTRRDDDATDNAAARIVVVDGAPQVTQVAPARGSTEGGYPLQVGGANFGSAAGRVELGTADCPVSVWTPTQIVCTVPPGAGVQQVQVIQAQSALDRTSVAGFAYDAPRVDAISPAIGAPEGDYPMTISGRDFGVAGATVTIAGVACTGVQHDAAQPHRRLACTVPAGTGTNLPVMVTQAGQSSDGSDRFAYAEVVADLLIAKSSARSEVFARGIDEWTLLVSNLGPDRADGARIVDDLPAHLAAVSWTCTGLAGAACSTAQGTGDVDLAADLPAGGSALVQITARLPRAPLIDVVNSARVEAPSGVVDPVPGNNADTETDPMATIFLDDFEPSG